ncbi:MAG: hypothetical protein R6V75_09985 [Bacteroidales bacterium]
MKALQQIRETINDLAYDIKAEVVIADLLENGLSPGDFITIPDGLFRRRYRKDLTHAELIALNNGQEILGLHLTREGLYDALPEALFHGIQTENVNSGEEMARVSKTQRIEEKECRNFFLPFENEIHYQRVQIEMAERRILRRFSENLFNDVFPELWNIDRSLPRTLVSRLMLFLHYAHRFSSQPELGARALEVILDEPVEWKLYERGRSETGFRGEPSELGDSVLGANLVCGNKPNESFPILEFRIGPLRNTRMEDYLDNGNISRLIRVFFDYFVPVEVIPTFRIQGSREGPQFVLSAEEPALLGFNTNL